MAQRQFRSDDTSPWIFAFGDGSDGAYSSVGNATDAPVDSSCSGTSGATSLTATNASFAAGKPILIHQSRGTGVGAWELNYISGYTAGTITTRFALTNTYTDSGASQAQVIQLKQYSSFTQNSGHTLTAKAWDGNVGGIIAFLCNGITTITGTLSGIGKGLRGSTVMGSSGNPAPQYAGQGEGSSGAGDTLSSSANGSGGGGGGYTANAVSAGGGGGGNGASGSNGSISGSGGVGGTGGSSVGSASLVTMLPGGGGGAPLIGNLSAGGSGASGGGVVLIITKNLAEITGAITLTGNDSVASTGAGANASGGGGAGGSCLIKAQTAILGSNKITASGGAAPSSNGTGGAGAVGRIHLDYLTSYTGTTTPTIDVTQDLSLKNYAYLSAFML